MSETLSAVFANLTLTFEDWSRQRTSKDMRSLKKKSTRVYLRYLPANPGTDVLHTSCGNG